MVMVDKATAEYRIANRVDGDKYYTPRWCVDVLLEELGELPDGDIYEPCAGSGAISDYLIEKFKRKVWASDISPDHADIEKLGWDEVPYKEGGIVITNPPYKFSGGGNAKFLITEGLLQRDLGLVCLLLPASTIWAKRFLNIVNGYLGTNLKRITWDLEAGDGRYVRMIHLGRVDFTGGRRPYLDFVWVVFGGGRKPNIDNEKE